MKPEIDVTLRANDEQFQKDLKNAKGEIDVDTKVNTAGVDAFHKKMLGVNQISIPVRVDSDAIRDAADVYKQARDFISDPIKVTVTSAGNQHVTVLNESLRMLRREAEILSNVLEGRSWGKVEFRGATVAVSDLRTELNHTVTAIDEIQEAMKSMGEIPVDLESQAGLQRALRETGDEAENTGRKIEGAMNVSAKATIGFSFNLKRLMASMVGMQSFYTLMNRASRQYMDSNRAIKASIMGVTDALGQMMAPAIHAAVKGLQTLIRWIMIALAYFKTFMNVVWGTNMQIQWVLHASNSASDGLQGMGKSAKKAGKEMEKAFKKMLSPVDELNVITDDTKDNMDGLGDVDMGGGGGVGDFVAPDMTPFDITDKIDQVKRFGDFLDRNRALFQVISGLLAILAGKWLINKVAAGLFGSEMAGLGGAFSGSSLIILAAMALIGGAIYVLITNWEDYEEHVNRIWEGLQVMFTYVLEMMLFMLETTVDMMNRLWEKHGDTMKVLWTVVLGIIEFVTDVIFTIVTVLIDELQQWWEKYGDAVGVVWNVILTVAKWVLDAVLLLVGSVMKLISGDFSFIGDIWEFVWETIKLVAGGILEWLKNAVLSMKDVFAAAANIIKDVFVTSWNVIGSVFKFVWDGILSVAKSVFNGLISIGETLVANFKRVASAIGNAFAGGWNFVKTSFTNVWNWILGKLSKGGSIFHGFADGVANVFRSMVNVIIRGINSIIGSPFRSLNNMFNRFASISILGARPFSFLGWNPLPVPYIPQFEKGYVGTQAQMGIFGEYTGARMNPEIVTPQDIMKETYREVYREESGHVQEGGDLHLTFNIDGKGKVTEVIKDYNQYKRNGGKLEFDI